MCALMGNRHLQEPALAQTVLLARSVLVERLVQPVPMESGRQLELQPAQTVWLVGMPPGLGHRRRFVWLAQPGKQLARVRQPAGSAPLGSFLLGLESVRFVPQPSMLMRQACQHAWTAQRGGTKQLAG